MKTFEKSYVFVIYKFNEKNTALNRKNELLKKGYKLKDEYIPEDKLEEGYYNLYKETRS